MKRYRYEILSGFTGTTTYQIPIFLEDSVDEMGIMVGFDGDMEQIEQFCNFTYKGNGGNSITVYNTLNTNKLKTLINSVFTVSWGDTTTSTISMPTVYNSNLPSANHTYATIGYKDIEITINSPWKVEKLKRSVYIPITGSTLPSDLGTLSFVVPYTWSGVTVNGVYTQTYSGKTQEQDYLEDYRTLTGKTNEINILFNDDEPTTDMISFLALGKSRIDEFKKYGSSSSYLNITEYYNIVGDLITGYTIDGLYYMDYSDGYTHITGCTTGYTTIDGEIYFANEEFYQGMITRNEHLIGFLDEPQIYSDIFVDRGKQGVMERNLRLGEIDSTGELDIYGSGFFKVKKQ
jgi:hypothetical protein